MEFQFKVQQYQTEAVHAVVNVFAGQHFQAGSSYLRDIQPRDHKEGIVEGIPNKAEIGAEIE